MALKKSELLALLLSINYVSDKYAGPYAQIKVPKGASFPFPNPF